MHLQPLHINDFDYSLPESHIAQFPLAQRDTSKLLVYNKGIISDHTFSDLPHLLPPHTHLVFNNSKVIPARIRLISLSGAVIEIFLLNPANSSIPYEVALNDTSSCVWQVLIGNKKKWKPNTKLHHQLTVDNDLVNLIFEYLDFSQNIIKIHWSSNTTLNFSEILHAVGQIPLPPYLNREASQNDSITYQTVYSSKLGAVAAPTAGLHFTSAVLNNLSVKDITTQFLTLHVGAGTFLPVKTENILDHDMHSEYVEYHLSDLQILLEKIDYIIPVGTTSMRTLESLYWLGYNLINDSTTLDSNHSFFISKLTPYQDFHSEISAFESINAVITEMNKRQISIITGKTSILIVPGYKFRLSKGIITNFHQPKSTLIVLIESLISKSWRTVYQHAILSNYRFLSYGDSSLLIP